MTERERESGTSRPEAAQNRGRRKGRNSSGGLARAYPGTKRALVALAASAVLAAQTAQAASATWSGGSTTDGNWSDPANWGGAAPGSTSSLTSGDVATFNTSIANTWGNSAANPVVIDQPNQNIGSITFNGAAGPYFIGSTTSGNPLLLSSGGAITLGVTGASFTGTNTTETVNAPLVLEAPNSTAAGAYSFINNSTTATDVLNIGGGITGGTTSSGVTLTLGGANTGANTIGGVIADGGAAAGVSVAVTGGTWALANANTYSGTTTISSGTLNLQNGAALGTGNSTVAVSGATADLQLQGGITVTGRALSLALNSNTAILENVNGSNTWSGNITVSNTGITRIFSDAGTLTLSGNITNGGSGSQFVVENGGAGVISGTLSGQGGLTHSTTGSGIWIISGPSNYTGPTAISNGAFDFENGNALTTTSQVTVAGGAALQLQGTITTGTAPVTLAGTGSNVAGATGGFENISGTNSYAGLITLSAAATISSDSGTLALTNVGTISGANNTLTLAGAGSGSIASIIGTTSGGLVKNGAGTWTLSGANTYTGATTVNAGTLAAGVASVAGVSGAFGNNSPVTIANTAGATLSLAGFNTQIASLAGVGTTNGAVTLGGATLTIATSAANSGAFAGVISGTGNLVLSGTAGTQTLSGNNTFGSSSNSVTINPGATLYINSATALGNIGNTFIINGGTIDNTSAAAINIGAYPQTWNGSFTFGGSTHSITATGNVTLTNNVTYTDSGAAGAQLIANGSISGNFVLSKAGSQPLTLGGNNSFAGLNILAGTVFGTSATAFGAATINLGDVSGSQNTTVNGSFAGTFANPISVTAGNTGVATLTNSAAATFSGAVTLANNLALSPAAFTLGLSGGITGTGNLTLNSTATAGVITLSSGSVNNTGIITNSGAGAATNVISAVIGTNVTGVIQNSAASALSLTGINTFASGVTIDSGTVSGNNASAFGGGTITLGAGSGSANTTLSSAFAGTIANPISAASGGTGIYTITSTAAATFSGAVTLNTQNLTVSPAANGITLTGGVSGTGNLTLNATAAGTINLSTGSVNNTGIITNSGAGAATNVISAVIGTNVTGVIQNSAASALSLTGVNTFTSGVTIDAGTVSGNNASAFGGGTITLGAGSGSANATLSSTFAGTIANPISVAAGGTGTYSIISTAATTFSGAVMLNTQNLTVSPAANSITLTGGVTGTGNLTLNATAAGAITLSTASVNNTGTITNSGAGAATSIISAVLGSNVTGVTQNSATSALLLSGVNTNYAGPVTLTSGTLIAASTSATGTGTVTLNGGTLASAASGTIAGNVQAGSAAAHVIAPGGAGSIGTLTIGGNLTTASNTTLAFDEISPTVGDLLVVNGTINATAAPIVAFTVEPEAAGTYPLISNSNAAALASQLTLPAAPTDGGHTITYAWDTMHAGFLDVDVTVSGSNLAGVWQDATTSSAQSWIVSGNWSSGNIPGTAGDTASFSNGITASQTVQLNGQQHLAGLTLDPGTGGAYAFVQGAAGSSLVFDNGAGTATLTNTLGSNSISAPVVLASNTTVSVAAGGITISGVVSGPGNLSKTGASTLTLSGANTFTGSTTVSAGILTIGNANALATTSSITVTGGSSTAAQGGSVALSGGIIVPASNPFISIFSAGNVSGGLYNSSGVNTWAPGVVITGGTLSTVSPFATNLGAGTTRIGATGGTLTISGVISGNFDLLFRIAGTMILSGANSYTGASEVGSGLLQLGANNSLPTGTVLDIGLTSVSGTFDLNGFNQTVAGFQITTGSDAPTTGLSNIVTNSSSTPSTLTFTTSANEAYGTGSVVASGGAGSITGNLSLVKLGTATFTLGPAPSATPNSYTGSTTIGNGTLALGAAGALPSTTTINFGTGSATSGTLDLHSFAQTVAGLSVVAGSGSTNQVINSVSATAGALTVAVPAATTDTFSGSLGGTGSSNNFSLTQSGSGTLALTSGNTYTGTTTISAGTLLAANGTTGSATGSGNISVTGPGTLGGGTSGGSIAGPAAISGGTLQGNSTGTLAFASTVTLTSGASFQFVLNAPNQLPAAPMVSVPTASSLTVPANTAVNLVNGGAEAIGTYYLLGYGSNADPYADLVLNIVPAGFNYSLIDDTTNESVDLSVSTVPEPGSGALLAAAALGLLARRRRRRADQRQELA